MLNRDILIFLLYIQEIFTFLSKFGDSRTLDLDIGHLSDNAGNSEEMSDTFWYFPTNQDDRGETVPVNISETLILKKLIGLPETGRAMLKEGTQSKLDKILESGLQTLKEINTDSDKEAMVKVYNTAKL